jgi:mono/diheme cytochrome c family protein
MRRGLTIAAAVISSVALIGVGAGCGDGDSAAVTPEDATTIANNAPQTDSEGKTVPAPGQDTAQAPDPDAAPADAGGADGAAAGGAAAGDVAAGKTVFEANCQGCHPAGGTQAGVGPQLSATALDAAGITNIVTNGQGAMPGGLVSGADLENVVAYVESLKG